MINQLKTISKETIIYGIGNAAGSIVTFLLLPLYTKFLTPEDYGYLAIFSVFQSVIEITAVFALTSGLFRYFLMAKDEIEQQSVVNTCFWTLTMFVLCLTAIVFPLSKQFSHMFFESPIYSKYISMVAATGLLSAYCSFVFSFMRAKRKPIFFALIQVGKVLFLTIANVYFVAVRNLSYSGIIIGNLLVGIVVTCIVLLWFSRFIGLTFSTVFLKKIILFSTPIYIVNVFFLLMNLSDRFFLNHFLSPTEVGLYSFGNKIGSLVMIGIITPFSIAIVPYALSIAKEKHFKNTFSKILKYFLFIIVSISLVVFYFSREIVSVVSNTSYLDASGIIGPILLSSIFYGLYYNLSIAIDIVEKTYLSTIVVVTGALVSICINYFTISFLGIYGSALASCISNLVLFLFMYRMCQKHFPIYYEVAAFVKLIGVLALYVILYYCINSMGMKPMIAIPIKVVLCLIFPIILFIFRFFDSYERGYAKNLMFQFAKLVR